MNTEKSKLDSEKQQCNIPVVCALHEQYTHFVSSIKTSKIQIYFYKAKQCVFFFSRGCKPLIRKGNALKY